MNKSILTLVILLPFFLKGQDSSYVVKWDDNYLKIEGSFNNGKKDGEWKEFTNKAELKELSLYNKGVLISRVTKEYYSHTKGLLYDVKYFEKNKLTEHRLYKFQNNEIYILILFNKEEKVTAQGKMEKDKREGKWLFYDERGIESEKYYENGIVREKEIEKWKIKPVNNFIPVTPVNDNAIIKIYRPWVLDKNAKTIDLMIGEDTLFKVANGACFEYEITENGVYQFEAKTDKTNILRLDVKQGRTYFLKVSVDGKFFYNYGDSYVVNKTKLSIVFPNKGKVEFDMLVDKNANK